MRKTNVCCVQRASDYGTSHFPRLQRYRLLYSALTRAWASAAIAPPQHSSSLQPNMFPQHHTTVHTTARNVNAPSSGERTSRGPVLPPLLHRIVKTFIGAPCALFSNVVDLHGAWRCSLHSSVDRAHKCNNQKLLLLPEGIGNATASSAVNSARWQASHQVHVRTSRPRTHSTASTNYQGCGRQARQPQPTTVQSNTPPQVCPHQGAAGRTAQQRVRLETPPTSHNKGRRS
jgi:hypothetical protein